MNNNELKAVSWLIEQYAKKELAEGFQPTALHQYNDEENNLIYFRIRLKHPDGRKWIRPFHFNTEKDDWIIGEPTFESGKPLYLLSNIGSDLARDVWVVEGEQKADLLTSLGFIAVTSGSSTSATDANWDVLRGRSIVIWRDFDESGLQYSQEVTNILQSIGCSLRYIDVNQLSLPDGGDVVDWFKANPHASKQDILNLLMKDKEDSSWPIPIPLTALILEKPYPHEALPDTVRAAVEEVQRFVKAPMALVASSALSAISLAIQTYIDVKRDEKLCGPTGLFFMTIADSGERKSTCDGFFMQSIYDYEKRQRDAAKSSIKSYEVSMAIWQSKFDGIKAEIKKLAKKSESTENMESALFELEHIKPKHPKVPRLVYSDATPEALKRNLATIWPSAGVVSSEGGVVLGAHAMQKDSAMRNFATYNQAWDGKNIPTDRIGSESFTAQAVRLTMSIQVQEAALMEFTAKLGSIARGIGYFARVLLAKPESTQGTRFFTTSPEKWPALGNFHQRITQILDKAAPFDSHAELTPRLMSFSPEAKDAWVRFHDMIENQLHQTGDLYDVRDVASKIADNAARLSALFQGFEKEIDSEIQIDLFEKASCLVLWHLNESKRFFGELSLSPELTNLVKLEKWLIAYCQKNNVDKIPTKIVLQHGPASMRTEQALSETINILQQYHRAKIVKSSRKKWIEINPMLLDKTNQQ
ncbi:YfjI family protein [Legionella cincinnatiensis]|uniref:5' DNA primase TraC n=1 Tax=Legionella cincinnatiensis TaxID=28085 RepID=A0A378INK1_9GAMM|nr:YfjI family protein [Legionella cincinnatiensis]KTC93375.1 5' DNA primase TraC [Legionella cincinnatiensis]STX36623.1 5' DNA primase TraC [Legionella cincinnatiensis]